MKNIIIIGGGASGFMAAILLARKGQKVTVLEKNDAPLKKLLVTGNGRCNLTNTADPADNIFSRNKEKALDIISRFDCAKIREFFLDLGVKTKSRDGWIYPENDSATLVRRFLQLEAEACRVKVKTNETVVKVLRTADGFEVQTNTWKYPADCVILSCGSRAFLDDAKEFVSWNIAEDMGLFVYPALAALTGIRGDENRYGKWAGVRVNACVFLLTDGRIAGMEEGELQLTDYGISGIPIFQLSIQAAAALAEGRDVRFVMDFCPDMEESRVEAFLSESMKKHSAYTLFRALSGLLPEKLAEVIAAHAENPAEAAGLVKAFEMKAKSTCGFERAQAAAGGVSLDCLDENLQAVNVPGFYVTGEACDVTGKCGGFNLTWAFASAAAVAHGISKN
ncbi:MAG: aminoacetone oxidase family FAD-binding enzyme [Eubacterium sp.]|nr:aminoacetone oxidase family FAD-binding enzyme [Eubacterium sp.]